MIWVVLMATKKILEKELYEIKMELEKIASKNVDNIELLKEKHAAEDTNSNMLALIKFMMDENKKTTMLMKGISDTLTQLTNELKSDQSGEATELQEGTVKGTHDIKEQVTELPISVHDAKIIEYIQVKGMACADDIKLHMNYKGRNAACARLNSLYKRGVLQRYQLGHKVYYKFDAGKATNTLIIYPPN